MIRLFLLLAIVLLSTSFATAGLVPDALDEVELAPPPNAHLPLDAAVLTETAGSVRIGDVLSRHPVSLVLFVDYTCRSVCGTALAVAAASLADPRLRSIDAGLVVIGIDPKDGPDRALDERRDITASDVLLGERSTFLAADTANVAHLTEAVGFRYRYDPATDQYAHPAAALVVDDSGRLLRTMPSLALSPNGLSLALVDAGDGRVGTLFDRIRLRCFAYDPVSGLYVSRVREMLRIGAIVMIAVMVAGIFVLLRFGVRRREAPR